MYIYEKHIYFMSDKSLFLMEAWIFS